MTAFVAQYHDRLTCDVAVVCDGSMSDREQPDIAYGLRGVVTILLGANG